MTTTAETTDAYTARLSYQILDHNPCLPAFVGDFTEVMLATDDWMFGYVRPIVDLRLPTGEFIERLAEMLSSTGCFSSLETSRYVARKAVDASA
jgi:hypothetical protein